jgi:hypothetical protein
VSSCRGGTRAGRLAATSTCKSPARLGIHPEQVSCRVGASPSRAQRARRYCRAVFSWLRSHAHLSDLVVVGVAVAMSLSLTEYVGIAAALALGAGAIAIINILLGLGSPHD